MSKMYLMVPEDKLRKVLDLAIKLSEQMEAVKNKDNPNYLEVQLLNSAIDLQNFLRSD